MRRGLLSVLAALAVLLFAAPSAFAARTVIFDPTPGPATTEAPDATCAGDTPCNVFDMDVPYVNTWIPCTTPGLPKAFINDTSLTWCLWFNNVSGSNVTTFQFSMVVPTLSDQGQDLTCSVSPAGIATWNCPSVVPDVDTILTATFFATPSFPNNTDYFIGTNFGAQPGDPTVVQSVPEPGVLGLFGLGLIAIVGVYGWDRRRHGHVHRVS